MGLLLPAVLLGLFGAALTAEESCVGRCDAGFNSSLKCQCDRLCMYYQSCCSDYDTVCKTKVTRGDVFTFPEDDYNFFYGSFDRGTGSPDEATTFPAPSTSEMWTEEPTKQWELSTDPSVTTEALLGTVEGHQEQEQEETCSGKTFDAFTDLKNGSIFAFRGKYFYELNETSVVPGYPKLIRDVWGMDGPIDAAFTRINCQGKTYIFKGSQYWRFDDGALDAGYPLNISQGFEGIPDDLDAAFALPAENYANNERVYFFKGRRYWSYEFAKQPTWKECEEQESQSAAFRHFAFLVGTDWEDIFDMPFGHSSRRSRGPRLISRDWRGLPSRVDAAVTGRIYLAPPSPSKSRRRKSRRQRKQYRRWPFSRGWSSRRFWPWLQDDSESWELDSDWLYMGTQCQPVQSVYFFVGDKYYRVNLKTMRVDWVRPRYPRPIAQYWLGCPQLELKRA
ncbi:PREDICTED: vitronectin isoform X2 [Crocodylus porosus]|uniref:vitronectin isoform X2 n=1 Tax=Crocodylus porosus TaxID=8502 RepID=UPI000939056B|nr:PREDICTED: vitronectin isoform X2 [Crocodylus porosus]